MTGKTIYIYIVKIVQAWSNRDIVGKIYNLGGNIIYIHIIYSWDYLGIEIQYPDNRLDMPQ